MDFWCIIADDTFESKYKGPSFSNRLVPCEKLYLRQSSYDFIEDIFPFYRLNKMESTEYPESDVSNGINKVFMNGVMSWYGESNIKPYHYHCVKAYLRLVHYNLPGPDFEESKLSTPPVYKRGTSLNDFLVNVRGYLRRVVCGSCTNISVDLSKKDPLKIKDAMIALETGPHNGLLKRYLSYSVFKIYVNLIVHGLSKYKDYECFQNMISEINTAYQNGKINHFRDISRIVLSTCSSLQVRKRHNKKNISA